MAYRLKDVNEFLFIDELQDAIIVSGIEPSAIAAKFSVSETQIAKWLVGEDMPSVTIQHAILNWLEPQIN